MVRKSLSALLLASLFTPVLATAAAFPDTVQTRYELAFDALAQKGVVKGYADGLARPNAGINRVEALKVILESNSAMTQTVDRYKRRLPSLPLFDDVDQSAWYAPYLEAAFSEGLVTGYPDQTFRPGNGVRTEEAVALIMRAYGERSNSDGAQWYAPYLQKAQVMNLFSDQEDLYLGEPLTRGQFIDMVYRLTVVREGNLTAFAGQAGRMPTFRPNGTPTYVGTPTAPTAPPVTPAVPNPVKSTYFAISLPSININDLKISRPTDPFTSKGILEPLKAGVGHLFGVPGGGSKILIYGHSSGYAWDVSQFTKVFRGINKLAAGDKVYVNYHGTTYTYEVTHHKTIPASDTTFIQGTGEELILYTCWPPDSIKERYLVYAKPVAS